MKTDLIKVLNDQNVKAEAPVIRIGDKAFYNKNTVTSVSLGSNIREIGAQAFANCSALKSITLSEGLLTIGDQAFQSCRALESAGPYPADVVRQTAEGFFGIPLAEIGVKKTTDDIH